MPASASRTTSTTPPAPRAVRLTPRQQQVLDLVCRGLTTRQMSRALGCRESTVKSHVGSVLRALNARTRLQAVATCLAQEQLLRELSQDAILTDR